MADDTSWRQVSGVVQRGHQVASGRSPDSPYPASTIALQSLIFKSLGVDLTGYFAGTLNVSIQPHQLQWVQPEFTFRQVTWTDRHPPEDFSFSRCRLGFNGEVYDAWIYYPHPETKQRNFQDPSVVEVIAPWIPKLSYGDQVHLHYQAQQVAIV